MSGKRFALRGTEYGFEWGPMEVTRLISDDRFGVLIEIKTAHRIVEVRALPTGRVLSTHERKPEARP